VADELETLATHERGDVALGAGEEVVDTDEIGTALQQTVAQMGTEKAGSPGDEDSLFNVH
jgi:hypothetical protein